MQSHTPIQQAVKIYLEGLFYAEEEKLRQALHPEARIIGGYSRERVEWLSTKLFVESCKHAGILPRGGSFSSTIDLIDTCGDAAIVKVGADYLGDWTADYLTLLNLGGRWQIVSKVFVDHGEP